MVDHPKTLKVAIIGGGPAGLGAAIELSKRPFIDWTLYEKKPVISEISNGLTVQRNTWRMLERMGAARHIKASDFFRPVNGHHTQHRLFSNGITGKLIYTSASKTDGGPPHHEPCRMHRAKLQQALLKEVDQTRVLTGKKLVDIVQLPSKKIRITFQDGFVDEVDLLVGADGIRSVVRRFAFPNHKISYTGASSYRTLVRSSDALAINGLPREVIFWHGKDANWVYTCPLGGDDFEITVRIKEPASVEHYSWGRKADPLHLRDSFADFCLPIQQLTDLVTDLQQFDYFAGPRLETLIGNEAVVLIGDASHPLSGAFGAGAGFALEDAFVLGAALEWAVANGGGLRDALSLFDDVRSPHYREIYGVLDVIAQQNAELAKRGLEVSQEIDARIGERWKSENDWMLYYDVSKLLSRWFGMLETDRITGRESVC
ncbi:hypothetical protein B0H66DRAFT_575832 [Apodospora peruviana]|uniref:FAD-binding domain-containing protein n=1 Tax=Apodospora peruviana TaxID=516989 RepID=A0AAE0M4X5_9PEZI|nr:hypothetical protein B0H66DRAFT_575832 [Apodospora peruviana]